MGIADLLPLLAAGTRKVTLSQLSGMIVAIDGYAWLHKSVFSCAEELVMGRATDRYLQYLMHRIEKLLHAGVVPFVVLDGGALGSKQGTEREREASRQQALKRALV